MQLYTLQWRYPACLHGGRFEFQSAGLLTARQPITKSRASSKSNRFGLRPPSWGEYTVSDSGIFWRNRTMSALSGFCNISKIHFGSSKCFFGLNV